MAFTLTLLIPATARQTLTFVALAERRTKMAGRMSSTPSNLVGGTGMPLSSTCTCSPVGCFCTRKPAFTLQMNLPTRTDPVLLSVPVERRATLLARLEEEGEIPVYRFDIHMQGEQETVFFELE